MGFLLLTFVACSFLLCVPTALSEVNTDSSVHVAFLTDCTMYSDWMTVGMAYSYNRSGQPGKITRVMCCSEDEKKKYPKEMLEIMNTHIAPSFTIHPRTGDHYAAYNKPEAVVDWLEHVTPEEEWILVLDSDMILRKPFTNKEMKAVKGLAVGARYTYMIGVANELAVRHIPEIEPHNDTLAGPSGRRGDQVGGFFFMHRDDLKRMAPLWLKYTEDVRADPEAWRLSGDVYATHPGDKPWISEMYGYAFGAAKAGVWHRWDTTSMIYPAYEPRGIPKVMHYGLLFEVSNIFSFDKHWHYDFDIKKCPPWDLTDKRRRTAGIFTEPPHPSALNKAVISFYYRDLLSSQTASTLNAAFCDYHLKHCPPSDQLKSVCDKVFALEKDINAEVEAVEAIFGCMDFHQKCDEWAKNGECTANPGYMSDTCPKSCKVCESPTGPLPVLGATTTLQNNAATSPPAVVNSLPVVTSPPVQTAQVTQTVSPVVIQSPPPPPPPLVSARQIIREAIHGNSDRHQTKELTLRCYRMALSLAEAKDCIEAATRGEVYEPKKNPQAMDNTIAEDRQAQEVTSTKSAADEELELHLQSYFPPPPSAASNLMPVVKTYGVWVVLGLVVLSVAPRLLARRRARSGLRSE